MNPAQVPDEIVDLIVEQVDLLFRSVACLPDVASWDVSDGHHREPVFKALCLTSKAFHRAAVPRLVAFVRLYDANAYLTETLKRLASFATFCPIEYRRRVRGIALTNFSVSREVLELVDHSTSRIVQTLPGLEAVNLINEFRVKVELPQTFRVMSQLLRIRCLIKEETFGAIRLCGDLLQSAGRGLTRLRLRGSNFNTQAWAKVLTLPALESLSLERVTLVGNIPSVTEGLARLRFLSASNFDHRLSPVIDILINQGPGTLEFLSLQPAFHPSPDVMGSPTCLPRLSILHLGRSNKSLCEDAQSTRRWLQAIDAGATPQLKELRVPESPWIYAELMARIDRGSLPALKGVVLDAPPATQRGAEWSQTEIKSCRSLFRAFLQRREVVFKILDK